MFMLSTGQLLALSLFGLIISGLFYFKIFQKAGYETWKAFVPYYNLYCLCDIVFGKGLLVLLLIIPFVKFFFGIYLFFSLGKVFGKETLFNIGLVLFAPIFLLILGFEEARYQGPKQINL